MSYANRLSSLRKKLVSRKGTPGYEKNCEAIEAEIARLEMTTSPSDSKSSAVASETNKDKSGA